MPEDGPVHFYGVRDPYGEFSNFAPFPVELGGRTWPTTEHYFQAQKFRDDAYREKIRTTKSPMIAARLGRSRKAPIRKDWESVKLGVMLDAVRAKFAQHPGLAALLRSTGDRPIVEHTRNDSFWGDGGDGTGRNELGRLLMQVREERRTNP